MNKKVLVIIGTRPEAIKMAPVIIEMRKLSMFQTKVCATGQHTEMVKSVLDFFNIKPDFFLDVIGKDQNLAQLASKLFNELNEVITEFCPDIILVHGDTSSAFIGSIVGYYHKILIGHVEAGLRTNNKFSPFPEEINRQIIGKVADYHFAPTGIAAQNLIKEGVDQSNIIVTGNTVIDSLLMGVNKVQKLNYINEQIKRLHSFIVPNKKIILITGHRRENFGTGFENICKAILEISNLEEVSVIYPVHPNPKVQGPVSRELSGKSNILLCDPLDYPTFIWLMKQSYIILTDSGGIQEEAPSLGIPVLVMRETTERPEALATGHIKLVGTDQELIIKEVKELLLNSNYYRSFSKEVNPYGDGKASKKIAEYINMIKF